MGTHVDGGAETQGLPGPGSAQGSDAARTILHWCRTMSRDAPQGSIRYVEGWNSSLQALGHRICREFGIEEGD